MKVRFLQRNLINEQFLPAGLEVEVSNYTKSVYGGCDKAEIEISGEPQRLFELINYLRNGVEIYDGHGNEVWWGYVQRVEIPFEKVKVVVDLDEMSNQVALAYNRINAGGNTIGLRGTSPWVVDEDSVQKFGVKELLESGGSMNAVEALTMATRLRNELAFPRVYVVEGRKEEPAKIECHGWWHTLGWRYCHVPTELALSFQTLGSGAVALFDKVKVAQSFKVSSEINLAEVELHIRKVGGAGDVRIDLADVDAAGVPAESLETATINAAEIGAAGDWVRASFSETYMLTPGQEYFLVIESAWSDENNYQVITLDPNNGYGDGKFFEFVDNAWVETAKDLPFRLYNNVLTETSQQLQNYLTDSGQFFSRVFVNDRSGLFSESFRNGDTTAITEAEDLLAVGTSDYRRLLARVNADRSVEVWKEPAEPITPAVEIRADNKLYYRTGAPVEENFDPTGRWISIEPIIGGVAENTALLGTKSFFCDAMEWSQDGGVQMKPANWKNPLDLRIQNG